MAVDESGGQKFPVPPITAEELLDDSNTQPARLAPVVKEARSAVRDALSAQGIVASALSFSEGVAAVDREARLWLSAQTVFIEPEDTRWIRARVIDDLTGAGPIQPLRRDPRTTEIIVFSPRSQGMSSPSGGVRFSGGTSVEFAGPVAGVSGLRPAPGVVFDDDEHVLDVVSWLAGKRPTLTGPRISATLSDGSRMQAVHGDVATGSATLALRRHPPQAHTICDLVEWGALPMEMARDLAWFVKNRFTMVVSGSTSSGKTTLLNALLPFVNPSHHLFIVEDTKEIIHPPYLQVSRRVARLPKGDAEGVSIRDHVKDALRFRPDIICIGELRDAAALEAMKAYNTGHEGSATTCHANDAGNTIKRLAAMMTESPDMPDFDLAKDLVASAVDIVVFVKKYPDGSRRVTEVAEVEKPLRNATGLMVNPTVTPLWTFTEDEGFVRHRSPSQLLFDARGVAFLSDCPVTEDEVLAVCQAMKNTLGFE